MNIKGGSLIITYLCNKATLICKYQRQSAPLARLGVETPAKVVALIAQHVDLLAKPYIVLPQ